jgi:hypothetical protein
MCCVSVDAVSEVAPFVTDYIAGVVGHVVVAAGRDRTGGEAIGVWLVSPTGLPTGAWILNSGPDADAEKAGQLLGLLNKRSVVSWDRDAAGDGLERLAAVAQVPLPVGWEKTMVRLPEALVEIAEERALHADAVAEYRKMSATKSRIEPLAWHRDVPTNAGSMEELARIAGLGRPDADCELPARALQLSRLVAWTAGLWQETEQVRLRRHYLVKRFGPARPLPPAWLAQLREAYATSASW